MLSFLKTHPFAVEAYFETSLVLTFAIPKEQLENLIPQCLELDTFQEQWAFIAVAVVQTKGLRPKGFPKVLGNDFLLVGYRIFVRYTTSGNKRLRGLFILKSETNKKKMEFLGNIFTHYNYSTADLKQTVDNHKIEIISSNSGFKLSINTDSDKIALPKSSPFNNWKEAKKFAGPLPFTFTYCPKNKKVLMIEGVRQNWQPQPVQVLNYHFTFVDQLNLKSIVLANAFILRDIPYYWKKGKVDQWTK